MATEKRLIDAYALAEKIDKSKHDNPHTDSKVARNHTFEHEHFARMVCCAPTEDAVEVVRCKDCKHYDAENLTCELLFNPCATNYVWYYDDFCSYGERRTNERKAD